MEKYYYVVLVNPTHYYNREGQLTKSETGKLVEKVATNVSIVYSGPAGLAIRDVKKTIKEREKTLFGIPYTNRYVGYDPFFMICEDNGTYLQDVITGRKYESVNQNSDVITTKLRLRKSCEISSNRLVSMLKELSQDEINRYKQGIINLENAIRQGYTNDVVRINKEKQQEENNNAYIKSFRNRYGR